MKTACGDGAMPCYATSPPPRRITTSGVLYPREEAHKNFDVAVECEGSSECAWERGSGTLYVTHTPAGYWDDEPDEWRRDDVRAELEGRA